jgi:acetyl-CoA acetyltransferase
MNNLLNQTAIVGIGQTEFSKNSGRSELQLALEASKAALDDAGIDPRDVDGTVTFQLDTNDEAGIARYLNVRDLRWTARTTGGGGGASATVQLAASAIASGAAKTVLIYRAFNERSGHRFGQPIRDPAFEIPRRDIHYSFGIDTPAKIYSLWYQPYMTRYGVTNEDLAHYVVAARRYAATNPNAWFHGRPITLADHQNSRWIVEPILRLLDCCQESDGGVALVMTSLERARDLRQRPVRVLGAAQSHLGGSDVLFNFYHDRDITAFHESAEVSAQLWRHSGLGPGDIDVAMIYENFSPVVFMALEGHGFCGPGEAKDFIREGHIDLAGSLPVNTHGGLLGEGYIHGVNNLLEGVRQIRGSAANQVSGAETALVSACRSAVVLGKA